MFTCAIIKSGNRVSTYIGTPEHLATQHNGADVVARVECFDFQHADSVMWGDAFQHAEAEFRRGDRPIEDVRAELAINLAMRMGR